MGWFTNKTKSWELQHMWGLFASLIFLPLFMLGVQSVIIITMAVLVKKRSWLAVGGISLLINTLLLAYLGINFNIGSLLGWLILPFLNSIYVAFITKEYLQREDIKTYHALEWGRNYYYSKNSLNKAILSRKDVFIENLSFYKREIEDKSIQNNIDRMTHLVNFIDQKDPVKSELFLVRHADTLERVLKQYDDIENSKLENETVQKSKIKLTDVIGTATKAFEQELTNQFKTEILEIDAETEVYLQNLENRNLINIEKDKEE